MISNFEIAAIEPAIRVADAAQQNAHLPPDDDPLPTKEEQAQANKKGILGGIGGAVLRAVEKQRVPSGFDVDDDDWSGSERRRRRRPTRAAVKQIG